MRGKGVYLTVKSVMGVIGVKRLGYGDGFYFFSFFEG